METHRCLLGTRVDATSYHHATTQIVGWALARQSRYVCAANVHMVMEGYDDSRFRAVVNDADLVTSDGVPLVWVLRILGVHRQQRVYGPDLTLHVCEAATEKGLPIALYGGTQDTLAEMSRNLCDRYPRLHIASALAPPFRELTPAEDETYTSQIIQSGATIVLVGLGCPKQERWMANHRGLIPAVMIGVGAAFDFHSGRVRQAPAWMQKIGLEWLFRLLMEPRRLWKRYLKHNPRFALYFLLQLLGVRRFREV